MISTNEGGNEAFQARVANPAYSFELTRKHASSPWVLTRSRFITRLAACVSWVWACVKHLRHKEVSMARKRTIRIRHPELTDEQWEFLAEALPEPAPSTRGGPKPIPNRPVVEGILWVLAMAHAGRHFRTDTPRPARAGDGWRSGKRRACGWRHGGCSSTRCTPPSGWTGRSASPMGPLPRRKKGVWSRENQARKGYEVDGGGRW